MCSAGGSGQSWPPHQSGSRAPHVEGEQWLGLGLAMHPSTGAGPPQGHRGAVSQHSQGLGARSEWTGVSGCGVALESVRCEDLPAGWAVSTLQVLLRQPPGGRARTGPVVKLGATVTTTAETRQVLRRSGLCSRGMFSGRPRVKH